VSCLVLVVACDCTPNRVAPPPPGPPRQPAQPLTGPGGRDYRHAAVSKWTSGTGAQQYWVFEPDQPRPASAPVVVFLHGWGLGNPRTSGAWIEHVVRRGHIVIYPVCQAGKLDDPRQYVPNAVASLRDALAVLDRPGHVKAQTDKVAFIGYSMGGLVAANLAACAGAEGLPHPRAMMIAQPGRHALLPFEDLSKIPADTLLVCVLAESDPIVGEGDGRAIYRQTTSIPPANKALVMLMHDRHGEPPLLATHASPLALDDDYDAAKIAPDPLSLRERMSASSPTGEGLPPAPENGAARIPDSPELTPADLFPPASQPASRPETHHWWETPPDAMDYYGYWKLLDGLCDAAFKDKNREYALGDTPQQRFMGVWSDGVPVKELTVLREP
jgi:dienelactone hydrolase